jgi:hypothetical protein
MGVESREVTEPIEGISAPAGDETAAPEPEPAVDPAPERAPTIGQLRRQRRKLWDERQEAVYHVGGLAVDLERRGIDDDTLVRRRAAAVLDLDRRLGEIDGELAEADERRRKGRTRMPDPAGYCQSCGAPYLTDAAFCSRCGARIHVPSEEPPTQVIEPDGDG